MIRSSIQQMFLTCVPGLYLILDLRDSIVFLAEFGLEFQISHPSLMDLFISVFD